MTDKLGQNIKSERKLQKISLKELAARVQVSTSFLSQVENGKNEPSLSTLKRISTCLSVTVSKLLGEEEAVRQMLVRRGARHKLANLGDGLEIEFLSAFDPDNLMEVCIHHLDLGGKSGAVPYSHTGQEVFIAWEGNLALQIEDQIFQMEEGDCFYLNDCTRMHHFCNASDTETAKMLCITNPPYFYGAPKM